MAKRASNASRIAKAREEAEATEAEKKATKKKAAKKKAAKKKTTRKRAAKVPQRMKIIWGVGKPLHEPAKTFPYKERAAAEAEAKKKGDGYFVLKLKVPMEVDE
ncbi:MAG: hypothetical protein ACYTDX_08970 [Planctomycetota bacterium]|jgi:hypothetical protein